MNLRRILHVSKVNPKLQTLVDLDLCYNYDLFIHSLYSLFERIVSDIQDDAHIYSKYEDEDLITSVILKSLTTAGIQASHDKSTRGNPDLVIEVKDYKWLGEAKIYRKLEDPAEGFLQLATRYLVARKNQNKGGLFLYIYRPKAKDLMNDWSKKLMSMEFEELKINQEKDDLCFYSSHTDETSGLHCEIKHIPVMLNFDPKDKSGRNRKNK